MYFRGLTALNRDVARIRTRVYGALFFYQRAPYEIINLINARKNRNCFRFFQTLKLIYYAYVCSHFQRWARDIDIFSADHK